MIIRGRSVDGRGGSLIGYVWEVPKYARYLIFSFKEMNVLFDLKS